MRSKVIKICPKGHRMERLWRTCPRCTGASPVVVTGRELDALTRFAPPPQEAPESRFLSAVTPSESAGPPFSATLTGIEGPVAGIDYELVPGITKVGKSPVESPGVRVLVIGGDLHLSREHAEITLGDAGVSIRDLGSLNGTLVDEIRVAQSELRDGAVVTLGRCGFRVQIRDSSAG